MIKLSKEIDYTIQFLLELANQNENFSLSLRKFSQNSNISFLFMQKIARKLRDANLVISTKGPLGGYILATPIQNISLADIAKAVDGEPEIVDCVKFNKKCRLEKNCSARLFFQKINNDLLNYLSQITLDKYAKN